MKLISNEFRTESMSIPAVEREVNEARGYGDDPLDLLIELEEAEVASEETELDFN